MRYDIRISGSGGQGIVLLGIIIAEAAILEGLNVAQTQSYGPEARGGSSKSEIVISDEEIDYPKAQRLDCLLAMSQKSCDDYYMDLKPEGILIVDSTFVKQVAVQKAYRIPFTQLAKEKLKKDFVANIVALGAFSVLTEFVKPSSLKEALSRRVPKGTEKLNLEAFQIGVREGRKAKKALKPLIVSERIDEDT
ncbi:MAG: 2-oxoacid:acceptor oxidoreductase family protein [Desulfobacterota bacterium]|nr:2-oxoacid:acceptor oxidoreductase family protein [Thermodesulfobacteriota bacterium]MDW8002288.1 2-oxoacid:acceptor oxidoreductase family protein [Deltaproteobacteria bacterium]